MKARLITLFLGLLLSVRSAVAQTPQFAAPVPGPSSVTVEPSPSASYVENSSHVPFTVTGGLHQSRGIFTAEADYMLWIFPKRHDSGDAATTIINKKDVALGSYGTERFDRHVFSGGQIALGMWQTEGDGVLEPVTRILGIDARFFFVPERSVEFVNDSSPTIKRPFFDLNNHKGSAVIVSAPGLATGGIDVSAQQILWGGEVNVWKNIYHEGPPDYICSVDVMAGFRYLGFDQDIAIRAASVYDADLKAFPEFAGFEKNRLLVNDSFGVRNRFYGAQVGINGNIRLDPIVVTAGMKLAIGSTHEELEINGQQIRILADKTKVVSTGGLLALPSNIGQFERDHFAQVPELDVKLAYPVSSHVTFTTGASALYWNRIIRASDQIQREIDITQIPNFPAAATATPTGFARPGVPFTQSSLWLLGVTVSVEFCW